MPCFGGPFPHNGLQKKEKGSFYFKYFHDGSLQHTTIVDRITIQVNSRIFGLIEDRQVY